MMTRAVRTFAGTLILVAAGSTGAAAQDLPDAKALLAKYHTAINASAWKDVNAMHSTGQFSMPAQGITASFEAWAARPGKSAVKVSIPGIGDVQVGVTGDRAWSVNPFEGPRLYEGAEQVQALDNAAFDSSLRPEALVTSMTTVEKTLLGGTECYKVKVVWKSGRETHDCYAVDTGLLVGMLFRSESNSGSGDAITLYSDYKEFGGMRLPTRMTTQAMGVEQVITISDVKFDAIEDSAFEPPAPIRALLGG
jgi:outer membrane lipoprotein-sorting protein